MITDPVVDPDIRDVRNVVRQFVRERFTDESVRSTASGGGMDRASWKLMAELGWTGLSIPEESGGAGLGVTELCVLLQELGGALAPVPFLSTAGLAVTALRKAASREAAEQLLPQIAEGTVYSAVVLGNPNAWPGHGRSTISAEQRASGWTLSGHSSYCLDADGAQPLLVVAPISANSYGLFGVGPGAAGVAVRQVPSVDITRKVVDLTFDATPADALHAQPLTAEQVASIVDTMAVLLAAEATGSAHRCLEDTLEYLRTRHQFGKPIGSFQALKHRCAEMAVRLTMAKELVFAAAAAADAGSEKAMRIAAPLALTRALEVSTHIAEEGIQLHGGIGFTDEAAVGMYYKRALSDTELLAHSVDVRARLARALADDDAAYRQGNSRRAA